MAFKFERDIRAGNTIRIYHNKKNPNNKLMHIRAIIDDDQVVYRVWNSHKRGWMYAVMSIYLLGLFDNSNVLYNQKDKVVER